MCGLTAQASESTQSGSGLTVPLNNCTSSSTCPYLSEPVSVRWGHNQTCLTGLLGEALRYCLMEREHPASVAYHY